MKLKKKVKIILIVLLLIVLGVGGYFGYKKFFKKGDKKPEEVEVIHSIDSYGYKLKADKSDKYKALFDDLTKILDEEVVNEEEYSSKIAEMFIYDFYTLSDKKSKTAVGGTDFVHPDARKNFLLNAEDTYYKYVESNIYNNRKQSLPTVDTVTIKSAEKTKFTYKKTTDESAYKVKATWTYTSEEFSKYQSSATLYFMHSDKILYLVELD